MSDTPEDKMARALEDVFDRFLFRFEGLVHRLEVAVGGRRSETIRESASEPPRPYATNVTCGRCGREVSEGDSCPYHLMDGVFR